MSIPGSLTPLFSTGSSAAAGGYQVQRSLRFNSSDSAYCSRTPAVAGNRQTWTWAGWVKRSVGSSDDELFSSDSSDGFVIRFVGSTSAIRVYSNSGGLQLNLITTAVYRDPSAWYHLVVAVNTTIASPSSDRAKIYVNGTQVTDFSTAVYPSQNTNLLANQAIAHFIGKNAWGVSGLNGYLADIHFIDGQALTPSSFTEVSATTGQLIPLAYSGTYGLVSVAAATGALPIFNTTDTYGAVKGTGTRTDTNSASIAFALPMDGTNGGTSFGDQSAVIKGSGSAKTVTVTGNTNTSTTQSKFYGSSGYFDGTGDYLQTPYSTDFNFGSGDFTIETFVNISALGTSKTIANYIAPTAVTGNDLGWIFGINVSNQIEGVLYNGSSAVGLIQSGSLVTGKWYHAAYVRSGTNFYMFLDGVLIGTATNSSAHNVNTGWNISIGYGHSSGTQFMNGYLQDLRIYKGVAKYTSNFSPVVSLVNSFQLKFSDNSAATAATLGKDYSGNSNNWTPNNLSVTAGAGNDSLVDTPTSISATDTGVGGEVRGNYATLNPLANGGTLANGNLDFSTGAAHGNSKSTIAIPASGKWYIESTVLSSTNGSVAAGIGLATGALSPTAVASSASNSWNVYAFSSLIFNRNDGGVTVSGSFTAGDVLQLAVDPANNRAWVGRNNTWYDGSNGTTGNPATGSNPTFTSLPADLFVVANTYSNTVQLNFGQRAFAYTAPSGFKALCDTNLPAPLTAKPNTLMDVVLYTGTGSNQSITGLGFSPDFVWLKSRSTAQDNNVFDAVRGPSSNLYALQTNATSAEGQYGTMGSLDASGFSLTGAGGATNANSTSYVAWAWDAGTSTVSNTAGSITSQVRANVSAGFSVVGWTSNGTSGIETTGHGLGVSPDLIIVKNRDSGSDPWQVFHSSFSNTASDYLFLNTTDAKATSGATIWTRSSTTFGYRQSSIFTNGQKGIAYCFAAVVGYSSFGSYTGNGSTDGPFVYTGFRPRFIILRNINGGQWIMQDTARQTTNTGANAYNLSANGAYEENEGSNLGGPAGANNIDWLSNGFKIRASNGNCNTNTVIYIYMAFAENPFQYARAR